MDAHKAKMLERTYAKSMQILDPNLKDPFLTISLSISVSDFRVPLSFEPVHESTKRVRYSCMSVFGLRKKP